MLSLIVNMPIFIDKKQGETPLEALNRLRVSKPEYKNERLSYAGRLDPLAEGLLLVLVGNECDQDKRDGFLGLKKEYEISVMFGISTDSYDLLGIPHFLKKSLDKINVKNVTSSVEKIIKEFIGKNHNLTYPPFSSKTINGKSLFQLSLEGKITKNALPRITGSIDSIEITKSTEITTFELLKHIDITIGLVKGDFRQDKIISDWHKVLETIDLVDIKWPIMSIKVSCDSGVYMRSLANELGERLGLGALAFSIKRTKVGDYSLLNMA